MWSGLAGCAPTMAAGVRSTGSVGATAGMPHEIDDSSFRTLRATAKPFKPNLAAVPSKIWSLFGRNWHFCQCNLSGENPHNSLLVKKYRWSDSNRHVLADNGF